MVDASCYLSIFTAQEIVKLSRRITVGKHDSISEHLSGLKTRFVAVLRRRIAVNDGEACKVHIVLRDASNRLGHKS